jgi:hypothetical protein
MGYIIVFACGFVIGKFMDSETIKKIFTTAKEGIDDIMKKDDDTKPSA